MMVIRTNRGGYLMVLVLVFAGIFLTILTSFVTFIVTQSRLIEQRERFEMSGQIAEAGLDYLKWYLAHYPNTATTSVSGEYRDPEGDVIGRYDIAVTSTMYCGAVSSLAVQSVGYTYDMPSVRRTLSARYNRPNVAEYSFILNASVWAGPDRDINGPYHSNGGIRMDGHHNSSVTSGQATWSCNSSFGCSPTQNRNGVFTTTGNATPALFDFPSPPINFAGITVDLAAMESRARNNGGIFLPKAPNGDAGYRIIFNSNNTITVNRVQSVTSYDAYTDADDWHTESNVINQLRSATNYTINPDCPLIVVQDKVWLSGQVGRKVTIAASHATSTSMNPSIILNDNITYSSSSAGLLAIAEEDILIGLVVPNDMELNGIFIAQNGLYGRNHYCGNSAYCSNSYLLPTSLRSYAIRNSETHNGTIVSNGRVGTRWTSGGTTVSGFRDRYTSYDRNLVDNPPPFIPSTSDVYEFNDWRDAN